MNIRKYIQLLHMGKWATICMYSLFILFIASVLFLSVRGLLGNPNAQELNTPYWKENGPFELSPERGRFALTYSLVEDGSLQFSDSIGHFADPDVAVHNGRYVSLFAPLVSFVVIPGYVIGKFFGASQVGTYAVIALFALFNTLLIRLIAIRLGAGKAAATIASLVFLFATPAFAYAVNLYQHHLSTLLILLSLYVLLRSQRAWTLVVVFFLCGLAIPLDYPNLFFLFPIGFYALGRIISFEKVRSKVFVSIRPHNILTLMIFILPIVFFLWVNQASYGNPLQLSGTLPSSKSLQNPKDLASISSSTLVKEEAKSAKKSPIAFFNTRNLVNGFYIHVISPDRGIIYYTPVALFGIAGFLLALRKKIQMVALLSAIIGANVLLYSMWGDPWGGWAFGSRYLIPTYAILSIFIALVLTYWRKSILFLIVFSLVFVYSIAVNTLGAITSSANPPQVEVLALEKLSGTVQKYTPERNWDFLVSGRAKSFVFQTFASQYITAETYYFFLVALIAVPSLALLVMVRLSPERKSYAK